MTLTGSDKDKVGRICQILPKVALRSLKVPQSGSNGLKKCPKVLKTGGKQADLQKPSKRGGDAHLVRFKVERWSFLRSVEFTSASPVPFLSGPWFCSFA